MRTVIKSILILTGVILAFSSFFTVAAEQEKTEYLYRLKDISEYPVTHLSEARLQSEASLSDKLGIFKTTDLEMLKEYEEMGILEFYEENATVTLAAMPNTDELMERLVTSTGMVPLGQSYAQVWIDELWKLGLSGRGITIGVIDSGVNAHDDLADNLLDGQYFPILESEITDNPSLKYDSSDGVGHGTAVAGLIAANGTNYRGVAYEAKIVPLKSFSNEGSAEFYTIANAMIAAVDDYDCDLINMSCGASPESQSIKLATEYVISKGVPIIAAAGNKGGTVGTLDSYYYPAAYDAVVAVGNIDITDSLYASSRENDMVDVVAPGTNVILLSNTNLSGYRMNTGTSFSCPIVTGIVALLMQMFPDITYDLIQDLLCATAYDLGDAGKDMSYGYGKVDCAAIVRLLLDDYVYASPIVKHNGTYNVAFYNGINEVLEASAFIAGYDGGKMLSSTRHSLNLGFRENAVMTFSTVNPEMKLFVLDNDGFMPLLEAVSLDGY